MKKEDIHLGDWERLLLGQAPLEFLVEAALRTLIVYVVLLLAMRLLGKRMNAQLTVAELSVMIMLGGIVSVPMQMPDRGILQGVLVLACMVALYRGINYLAFRYKKVEYFTQGDLEILVVDGVLDLAAMERTKLSRDQLFANLRAANIEHLGQVKRAYLEASGTFSIYEQEHPQPGLSVLPAKDPAILRAEPADKGRQACQNCGRTEPTTRRPPTCPRCGAAEWAPSVTKL
jgi:uncharacterized membrane protein YcaP (DUF421 family)